MVREEVELLQGIIVDRSKEVIGLGFIQFGKLASIILGYRSIFSTVIDDLILRAGAGDNLGVLWAIA